MENWNFIQKIAMYALPVIFAITMPSAVRGYVAKYLGDNTAEANGRLTLNPLKHIDILGTLILPGVCIALGGFLIGWSKSVPVDYGNMRKPREGILWVALAGPATNIAMVVAWALLLKLATLLAGSELQLPMANMAEIGIVLNVIFMVLSLLPIPPLDGGRILIALLPARQAMAVSRLEPYGMLIVLALVMTGVLSAVIRPVLGITGLFLQAFL